MWNIHIFDIDFIDAFYNFFIYSFLGWIYESTYVSIIKKTWVNRGFMNGPVIPIYGAGATLVYLCFWQYREQALIIFIGGMILATVLEYFTSLVMELLFHAKWWDYSYMKYNFHGRVCLKVSLFWGVLSIIMIELIQPHIVNLLELFHRTYYEYIAYMLLVLFVSDLMFTVIHTLELNKMLGDLQKLKQEFVDYIESTKLFDSKEELKHKLSNHRIYDLLENFKSFIEENKEKLIESNKNREGFEIKRLRYEIDKHMKDYLCKFQKRTSKTSHIQKRLLKAFPNIKFMKREEVFADLKERIQKYKLK